MSAGKDPLAAWSPVLRIVITGPFFFPQVDGVEKVMLNHARHLARRGHEVHVVTSRLRYPSGCFPDVPDREEMEGFHIHRLTVRIANAHWRFSYLNNGGVGGARPPAQAAGDRTGRAARPPDRGPCLGARRGVVRPHARPAVLLLPLTGTRTRNPGRRGLRPT
jgi:glycosyltransferase involved in cell wall biosynthesis